MRDRRFNTAYTIIWCNQWAVAGKLFFWIFDSSNFGIYSPIIVIHKSIKLFVHKSFNLQHKWQCWIRRVFIYQLESIFEHKKIFKLLKLLHNVPHAGLQIEKRSVIECRMQIPSLLFSSKSWTLTDGMEALNRHDWREKWNKITGSSATIRSIYRSLFPLFKWTLSNRKQMKCKLSLQHFGYLQCKWNFLRAHFLVPHRSNLCRRETCQERDDDYCIHLTFRLCRKNFTRLGFRW